nr:ABC transporter ATP-binding protein/permease [Lachnospiraceae bacterium]
SGEFLILLAIGLIVVYLIKNLFLIHMNNCIYRFNYDNQRMMAKKLLETYLKEPYIFFLNHNSAELVRNVKEDTNGLFDTMIAIMQLVAEVMVTVVLFAYLLYKDKTITIIVGGVLIVFVYVIMRRIKSRIELYGTNTRQSRAGINMWLLQTFGGVKESMVMNRMDYFSDKVDEQYNRFVVNQKRYQIMSYIPKPLMESMCICTVLLSIIIKLMMGVSPDYFVSTVAVFAVAAFRLLPAFNRITGYLNRISFGKPSMLAIYDDFKDIERHEIVKKSRGYKKLEFNDVIELKDVKFAYPNTDKNVIESANITIPKNKSVAFIGPSGAGKTTMADIILGLLYPLSGKVTVDGVNITDRIDDWRLNLGYIPQSIFLLDDTIRTNIAYGIEEDKLDEDKLTKAIEDAQLKEFIDSLEEGLDTIIGENGVRLSGGQRQRIGIARALYSDPEVLILDEATSALDNDTEAAVMEAIEHLSGKKTLIIIAHRLSTIRNCDIVYEVSDGTVKRRTDMQH